MSERKFQTGNAVTGSLVQDNETTLLVGRIAHIVNGVAFVVGSTYTLAEDNEAEWEIDSELEVIPCSIDSLAKLPYNTWVALCEKLPHLAYADVTFESLLDLQWQGVLAQLDIVTNSIVETVLSPILSEELLLPAMYNVVQDLLSTMFWVEGSPDEEDDEDETAEDSGSLGTAESES